MNLDCDVSGGIKNELYEGVLSSLDRGDREVVEGYSPRDITLVQRIDGRGMYWHDARYLWMRLLRSVGRRDFGPTKHTGHRVTVIREDALLEAVNGLCLEHRERLLRTIEGQLHSRHNDFRESEDKVRCVIEDIYWDRLQTFKDLLLRGKLVVDSSHQGREHVFLTELDREALIAIAECYTPVSPITGEDEEDGEEEGGFEEQNFPLNALEQSGEDGIEERIARDREVFDREQLEKKRLHSKVLSAWRDVAIAEEAELLTEQTTTRLEIELAPYIQNYIPPRFGVGLCVES